MILFQSALSGLAGSFTMEKEKSLYFYALVPPEEIRSLVTGIKMDFKRRYDAEHALKSPAHITLIPPFFHNRSEEIELIDKLNEFSSDEGSFEQELEGFGTFPRGVIYIIVKESVPLVELHRRLEKFLLEKIPTSRIRKDTRKFHPHMTVAFKDLSRENFHRARKEYIDKHLCFSFNVESVSLLRHNGRYWEIIHEAPFNS